MSNSKARLLKESLMKFYTKKNNLDKVANVINKKTDYSLRVIEWFCGNYAKKNNIVYKIKSDTDFNVYLSYKAQLNSYQKKQFDPFNRTYPGFESFYVTRTNGEPLLTTVGQLNFFKWCITNGILDYIQKHLTSIKEDMNDTIKYPLVNPKNPRKPLSIPAIRTCIKRYSKVILEFD
jgi:hypothetical protein